MFIDMLEIKKVSDEIEQTLRRNNLNLIEQKLVLNICIDAINISQTDQAFKLKQARNN